GWEGSPDVCSWPDTPAPRGRPRPGQARSPARSPGPRRGELAGYPDHSWGSLIGQEMREMTSAPRLSIGLPTYNGENFLAESLDALLGQSYEDFELIISDNASTDGTEDICHRYAKQDSRIRYIRQRRNIGCAPNHNYLVGEARG